MNRRKRPEKADASQNSVAVRVRATLALIVCLLIAIPVLFVFGGGRSLLMPGQLSSGHAAIKECRTCHTASGSGQLSWLSSMLTRDPHNDTVACLNCHKIDGQIAFYPHTATPQLLNGKLEHLRNVAARTRRPPVAGLRDIAFPMDGLMNTKIYCATCHTDHKGAEFNIAAFRDSQCQSCHTVQFDGFDGNHPDFTNFPFKRRQRIKFDHASHFTKHYPETASKNAAGKRIPDTCAECHTSRTNREHMAVLPFDEVCSTCHIDQITGAERAVGPKGLAFISLPGIDVRTLSEKGISVGEWPELSEAELSPFMALMIGQKPEGEAMLTTLKGVDLLDLTDASDEQINAVQQLVWSIKGLLYALLSGKASDVLADLNASKGTQVNPRLISDLSANLPRDVIINAQLEWLPNLSTEMLQRRATLEQEGSGWSSAITEQKLSAPVAIETAQAEPGALANPPEPADEELIRFAQAAPDGEYWTIDVYGRLIKGGSQNPAASSAEPAPDAGAEAPAAEAPVAADASAGFAADTVDAAPPDAEEAPIDDTTAAIGAPTAFAPIESSVDTESWAEYGGWYRQDYAIYYRPAGHKDKFIYAWLNLTGPNVNSDNTNAAGKIFSQLTLKDAQGQCIKCHSIDSRGDSGFNVNWMPSSQADKWMRFTRFVHEPHFAVMENDGCLTCHQLDRKGDFAKTYEQGNPAVVSANFSTVKKGLCVECHGAGGARDDCLLCHQYHVQDVITPIIRTQLPRQ
jgi:hypothetical protein